MEIESRKLVVLTIDESHLLWGDTLGYTWGNKNEAIEVEMTNMRERQTYYGAIDILTKKFIIQNYPAGNGENTVKFVKHIESLFPDSK